MSEEIENLEILSKWLKEISKNNDNQIRLTNRLKTILLNLKIVSRNNKEIMPLENALERIIKELHDDTYVLVTKGRKELTQAFNDISNFVKEKNKD